MADTKKVAVVVGVGTGLGAALVKRFARGGYAVAMMARRGEVLTAVAGEVARDVPGARTLGLETDATDEASMHAAFERTRSELGDADLVAYNAGAFARGGVLELSVRDFEQSWRANCLGGLLCAREVLPAMVSLGRGTLIFTGATASRRGAAGFASLAVGKSGLRSLAESTAREFGPKGVHVAHVVVDGQIDTPRVRGMMPGRETTSFLSPDAMAETWWALHQQHPSAWTFELDVRPGVERF